MLTRSLESKLVYPPKSIMKNVSIKREIIHHIVHPSLVNHSTMHLLLIHVRRNLLMVDDFLIKRPTSVLSGFGLDQERSCEKDKKMQK